MMILASDDHRAIRRKEAVTFCSKLKDCTKIKKKLPLDFRIKAAEHSRTPRHQRSCDCKDGRVFGFRARRCSAAWSG